MSEQIYKKHWVAVIDSSILAFLSLSRRKCFVVSAVRKES